MLTYDPSLAVFCLSQERMRFPEKGNTYSINEGNYIKFPMGGRSTSSSVRKKIRQTPAPYTFARYIGSLVADFHRNLLERRHPFGIRAPPATRDGVAPAATECNLMAFPRGTGGR